MSALFTPIDTRPSRSPPPGWRWALLGDVARLESGHTPSRRMPAYWDGGDVPWLSLRDVSVIQEKRVFETTHRPTQTGIDNSSARLLPAETVAFCRTASVGKVAILGREMATSQDFVNWVCGPAVDPEYLYFALRSSGAFFDREKQGTTHKTIYFPTVRQFQVLLPPLQEQKRLAAILDTADGIRRKRAETIRLTEEVLRSAFLEMFGDPVTNPKGWRTEVFTNVVADRTAGNSKVPQSAYLSDGRLPIVDQGKEFIGGYSNDDTLIAAVPLPAVVFGDHTKEFKWLDEPFILGADGVKVLVPSPELDPAYLYWACKRFTFPKAGYSRHFKFLKRWEIPLPPIEQQRRFHDLHARHRRRREVLDAAAAEGSALVQSLTQRAFRGDL